MDILKQELKSIESSFGKTEIRNQIRSLLETRVTEICDSIYYSTDLSKLTPNSSIWTSKLNECISQMTRSGLGRTSTTLISDELMHKMTEIARNEPFIHHPVAQEKIISTSNEFIKSAFHDVVNQVENTIKPFKYDVEVSNEEWKLGIDKSCAVLDGYKKKLDLEANEIKQRLGRRLLKECNEILSRPDSKMIVAEEALKEAKIVAENTRKSGILSNRMRTLKSRQCVSRNDSCGEAVLFALTEKLAYSATMFINMELVDEFFYTVPTILERELYYGVIGADGGVGYSKENKKIKEWLEAIKRKETLESVLKTLQGLSK